MGGFRKARSSTLFFFFFFLPSLILQHPPLFGFGLFRQQLLQIRFLEQQVGSASGFEGTCKLSICMKPGVFESLVSESMLQPLEQRLLLFRGPCVIPLNSTKDPLFVYFLQGTRLLFGKCMGFPQRW